MIRHQVKTHDDVTIHVVDSASADKKLDAVAAVVTKLVEQRKAMHEQIQKMISANEKEGSDAAS
jgi:fatty acid-binding protein DegV